jgi:hypothetical protein
LINNLRSFGGEGANDFRDKGREDAQEGWYHEMISLDVNPNTSGNELTLFHRAVEGVILMDAGQEPGFMPDLFAAITYVPVSLVFLYCFSTTPDPEVGRQIGRRVLPDGTIRIDNDCCVEINLTLNMVDGIRSRIIDWLGYKGLVGRLKTRAGLVSYAGRNAYNQAKLPDFFFLKDPVDAYQKEWRLVFEYSNPSHYIPRMPLEVPELISCGRIIQY